MARDGYLDVGVVDGRRIRHVSQAGHVRRPLPPAWPSLAVVARRLGDVLRALR